MKETQKEGKGGEGKGRGECGESGRERRMGGRKGKNSGMGIMGKV